MYCGSCYRDNALAAELLSRGHEVTLVPVYTPTRTDEPNLSRDRVLFGGISVYLQQHSWLFRNTPRVLDRLWDSPRVIQAFAGRAVSTNPKTLGDLTVSMLRGEQGLLQREFDKLIEWIRDEPLPDVINLPNSLLIALAAPLRRAFRRPVCCTLQGEELFLDGLIAPYRDQALDLIRRSVNQVDVFVAVSDYCAKFMSEFLCIPSGRMAVVPLGINMAGYDRPEPRTLRDEFCVGYFARLSPEKGLHVLAEAYVRFRRRIGDARAKLVVAGHLPPDQQGYLNDVRGSLARAGLEGEFSYLGAPDRAGKLAFLKGLDLLSVPATYDEPKGMFLLEAMAAGVPVVQPRRGAFTEIVENTGGGILVEPDNPDRLADGLYDLWKHPDNAAMLGRQGFDAVRTHYSVARSADRLLDVYRAVVGARAPASAAPSAVNSY